MTVVPSFPAPSFTALSQITRVIAPAAREFQIDIVDGEFVPLQAWPFTEVTEPREELKKIAQLPTALGYELDCMVREPQQYLHTFVELGIKRVIIHHTSTEDYDSCLQHARKHGYRMGIAVLPHVAFGDVRQLIEQFEYVQVMGIKEVGQQGQPFAPEALELIRQISVTFPDKDIAVDGAVNAKTVPALVAAGATRLAPGSAITRATDPVRAYHELVRLAESSTGELSDDAR